MTTKNTKIERTEKIIDLRPSTDNGKEIRFDEGGQFYSISILNLYHINYGSTVYQIDRIVFFDAEGERFVTRGWLAAPGVGGKSYKSMELLDGGEPAKIKRKTGSPSTHFKKGEPFIQSRGRDYSRTLLADLYIPIAYLEALGWVTVEKTSYRPFETNVEVRTVIAPSEGSNHKGLFYFHEWHKTIKHFEEAKEAFIRTLQNATTKEDIEAVISEFKYKF